MRFACQCLYSTVTAAPILSSSSSSLLCAQQRLSSSLHAGEQSRVTRFFAALFPVHFAGDDAATDVTSKGSALLRRALSPQEMRPACSKWREATPTVPLRPWHVIAHLNHAALHNTNGEDFLRRNTAAAATGDHCASKCKHNDSEQGTVCVSREDEEGVTVKSGKERRRVTPSEIARLVCRSVRAVQQHKRNAPDVLTETTTLTANTLPFQEVEKGKWREGETVRDDLPTMSKEAILTYVLDAGDSMNEATKLTLEPLHSLLHRALRTSAHAFHLTFETLVRDGQERTAVELFRRWWRYNPHLFPIELDMHIEKDLSSVLCDVWTRGDTTVGHWNAIAKRLARIPYKKYMVSSALFTRVLMVSLRLGDPALEDEFIFSELIYRGVYMVLCGSSNDDDRGYTVATSAHADLQFHVFQEKYEDWLVLIGAIAAAALLERHADFFLREQRGGASYDRLVHNVRNKFMTFIEKACCPQVIYSTKLNSVTLTNATTSLTKPLMVPPGWAKLLFTTVLRCYEGSGVFHASPARRPGNTAALWQQIHGRLLQQFPHVFHSGNTVTTLLSFAALEETAVSSLGTHRMSFSGKEEALYRWRLQCRLHLEAKENMTNTVIGATRSRGLSDLPRVSRRLQSRFVAAHSSSLNSRDNISVGNGLDNTVEEINEEQQQPYKLHWKHQKQFGSPLSIAASQLSIPVFATTREIKSFAEDALDEIEAARCCALQIFRDHASLPVLCPSSFVDILDVREQRSRSDIVAEASQVSIFLFLRLISLLALMGEPSTGTEHQEDSESYLFPLVECVEKDILPYCHPSVAAFLRRCCATYLSRSGARGIEALASDYQALLEQLNEEASVERLLVGVLWGGNDTEEPKLSLTHYSFGSGSLAWQIVAQHRRIVLRSEGKSLLEMVLSHLVTLSVAIPDDYRRIVCLSPYMQRVVSDAACEEIGVLSALRNELCWNLPPAVHIYISLLELLSWVLEEEKEVGEGVSKDLAGESNTEGTPEDDIRRDPPSLVDTARHWSVLQRCLRPRSSSLMSLPPILLERVCLILMHSCPDVELLLACLLRLCYCLHKESKDDKKRDLVSEKTEDETVSFITPRLLTSLCWLLVMNGVNGSQVLEWRQRNGVCSSFLCGDGVDNIALHTWHLTCFERIIPATFSILEEDKLISVERPFSETNAATYLLGSVVLDILLRDDRWLSLRSDNYYVSLFASVTKLLSAEAVDKAAKHGEKNFFSLGVVLPSRQMASAYPAGVRQRVTNLKDALREMGAEERLRLRSSLSPPSPTRRGKWGLLRTYLLTDYEEEDDEVHFFRRTGNSENGVKMLHRFQ